MLFGEHAVLYGGPAIAAAIDCRLSVRVTPRIDDRIDLQSALGAVETTVHDLSFGPRLRFVEAAFRTIHDRLTIGVSVVITSSIDPTVGLASSASVTVALLAALHAWLDGTVDRQALLIECCDLIRRVQGFGSGADAASIIYGGVISYQMDGARVTQLTSTLPLVLAYSGRKTPTPEVIRYVQEKKQRFPGIYERLFSAIDAVTTEATIEAQRGDLSRLGQLMNCAHGLMEALSVGTPELSAICWALRAMPTIFGAKISGSGLGDAVVALGHASQVPIGRRLSSSISEKGLEVNTWNQ
jgi:mevalonate kinase